MNDSPVQITTIFPVLKKLPKQLTNIQLNDFLFRGTVGPGSALKLLIRGDATLFGLRVIVEVKVGTGKELVLKGMLPTQNQDQMKGVSMCLLLFLL